MGAFYKHNVNININPPISPESQIRISTSPSPLLFVGLNLPVVISTASLYLENPNFNKVLTSSITVLAHLDTGASKTSIHIGLAQFLNLIPTGSLQSATAGGLITMPTFAIDLHFPNTNLASFINLQIGSCNLNFNMNGDLNDPNNFAILLGRDILSRWNIVWNGPTSTVLIND